MVDLAKIRKKAKKILGNAGVPPAGPEAAAPPPPESGGGDAAGPAGETPALHKLERFKELAGKLRETRAETQVAEEPQNQLELLTFTIAGEHYAVDIERIVEIVTPRPVTRIPNADPSIVGIISLRGTIVTLVDARRRLRHPGGSDTPDTRIVVIDFRNETVGFVVDRVLRVVKIASEAVEPHPVVHTTELEDSIRGVFRTAGALTILLDLDKLLDHSHGPDL
ncbi:MAG TPA: chemotaxis protein CheW [Thermoanaerobaculia bacterium]|jgi:purine-binding chemotaxis protein CheW|nr:chemotaxis protein CheW [Thermoanaerobaculia bacterium]